MTSKKSDKLILSGLVILCIVPALGGVVRLNDLANGTTITPENARFFAMPLPVVLHIFAALLYSFLGAFQVSPGFRRKHREWHRKAGMVLIPCALIVVLTGLWMTLFYSWAPGDGLGVYLERLVFGTAMLLAIVLGIDAIRRRNFSEHGAWMLRAYAIGMGAATQVLTHLPWMIFMEGKPGETPRAIMMGAGWVINVLIAEWIIRRPAARPKLRPKPALAAA